MTVTRADVDAAGRRHRALSPSRAERRLSRQRAHLLLAMVRGWRHHLPRVAVWVGRAGMLTSASAALILPVALPAWWWQSGRPLLEAVGPLVSALVVTLATFVVAAVVEESSQTWLRLRLLTAVAIDAGIGDDVIVAWLSAHHRHPETAEAVLDDLLALER